MTTNGYPQNDYNQGDEDISKLTPIAATVLKITDQGYEYLKALILSVDVGKKLTIEQNADGYILFVLNVRPVPEQIFIESTIEVHGAHNIQMIKDTIERMVDSGHIAREYWQMSPVILVSYLQSTGFTLN